MDIINNLENAEKIKEINNNLKNFLVELNLCSNEFAETIILKMLEINEEKRITAE